VVRYFMIDELLGGQRLRAAIHGCPPPTAIIGRLLKDDEVNVGSVLVGGPGEPAPSEERLFVYFVSPDVFAESFGTRPYFRTIAETFCGELGGDNCGGVTTALYVPPSITADALRQALIDRLNLRPLMNQE